MKTNRIITLILMVSLTAAGHAESFDAPALAPIAIRSAVVGDVNGVGDTAMTAFDYSAWPSDKSVAWPKEYTTAILEFYSDANDNAVIPYKVYVKFARYGHAQLVADGNAIVGTMVVGVNPTDGQAVNSSIADPNDPNTPITLTAKWCDTLTNAVNIWPGGIYIYNSGANRIAMIAIPKMPNAAKIYVEFVSIPANRKVWCVMLGG